MSWPQALVRPLGHVADPLALYVHLTGGRANTMLFERPASPTLILTGAALRLECRGGTVSVSALGETGSAILEIISRAFGHRRVQSSSAEVLFAFPRIDSVDPAERLTASSPFDLLRFLVGAAPAMPADPFARTCLGIVAFDHVDLLEDLPRNAADRLDFPDLLFWVAEELIVVEPDGSARANALYLDDEEPALRRLDLLAQRCGQAPQMPESTPVGEPDFGLVDLDDSAFEEVVRTAKAHICSGDVYQIVPSRIFRAPCLDPLAAFATQRRVDPSPYCFYVAASDHVLFGCSPESAVRVGRAADGALDVEVKPIAGTRGRGASTDEDDRLEADLRLDEKEVAEHLMLVDLARNDVARVSEPGSRRVAALLNVERYARVMHLVSRVTGRLAARYDCVHALQACLNVGTLSGSPKMRAIELLRGIERNRRGAYGGAVGWLNGAGEMDTGVIIRSAVVHGGTAFVQAGAGIVQDSDPEAEAEETKRKAATLLSVLAGMER